MRPTGQKSSGYGYYGNQSSQPAAIDSTTNKYMSDINRNKPPQTGPAARQNSKTRSDSANKFKGPKTDGNRGASTKLYNEVMNSPEVLQKELKLAKREIETLKNQLEVKEKGLAHHRLEASKAKKENLELKKQVRELKARLVQYEPQSSSNENGTSQNASSANRNHSAVEAHMIEQLIGAARSR